MGDSDGDGNGDSGTDATPVPPPDAWPAWLWIGLGTLIYMGAPELYDTAAGATYFLLGSGFALLVAGSVTARFNHLSGPILNDLLPGDDATAAFISKALRGLLIGMEAVMVAHLSRTVILVLAS